MTAYKPVYTGRGYIVQEIDTTEARSIGKTILYRGYGYENELFISEPDAWQNIHKMPVKSYRLEELKA